MPDAVGETSARELSGARVLVTGAAGFLGSHLARALVRSGCEVGALARDGADRSRLHDVEARVQWLSADLADDARVRDAVGQFGPDVVFHLGAFGVNAWTCDPAQAVMTNVLGTTHLLEACRTRALRAFVYAGTSFEYADGDAPRREDAWPEPVNAYAASKTAGWLFSRFYERVHQVPVVTVRPFQVYGPAEATNRLIPSVILSALQGHEVEATEGRQVRDFIFVEDVIAGMIRAAVCREARGGTFNLGTGQGVSVREMIEQLMNILRHPVSVAYGALSTRPGEYRRLVADTRLSSRVLGWQARVPLTEGLQRTVAWFTQHLRVPA